MKVLGKLCGIAILVILLTGCRFVTSTPNESLVRQAIDLQLSQTQQELTQKLKLDRSPTWKIEKLQIDDRQLLSIEDLPTFRLSGTYDLRLQLSAGPIARHNQPFEVYLQLQPEGKTWRLARPLNTGTQPIWKTDLLKPPGYH
ncbi:MAG: hypothetical protein WBF52_14790, partial [Geitlerinemataceae cyanobacterium]